MKRILVFGSFDGLHEGHKAMLQEAGQHGKVVACLAQDSVIKRLKKRAPINGFMERQAQLMDSGLVQTVIAGDDREGDYECLIKAEPDIVAFGYDQKELRENWLKWQQRTGDDRPHIVLQPYQPETYKSSLLRDSS